MKNTLFGLALVLIMAGQSFAQTIDQDRMDRDLKIAEKILSTLGNESHDSGLRFGYSSHDMTSSYIPDYGVIFTIPSSIFKVYQKGNIISSGSNGDVVIYSVDGNTVDIAPPPPPAKGAGKSKSSSYSYSYITHDDCDDCPKTEKKTLEEIQKKQEEQAKESEEAFKKQVTAFLVDYADLIGQLKPSDKIMVTSKNKSQVYWIGDGRNKTRKASGLSAEILKSDLIAFKQGKASREATAKKIKFTSNSRDEKVERDLELFGSIFAKLYDSDISRTYYSSSHRINYDWLDNFGVIYNMRVYSSSQDNGLHRIRTTGEGGLTQEQRNAKVNAMYPDFERSMKENIVDYGRTIKSLKPNEMLMFKVRLTECKGCDMPRSIEMSIRANVLQDYSTGKLTRDKAIAEISVKKTNN